MLRGTIYQMEVPHREPIRIRGFEFGDERGERSCAIVGSMRGNEIQQTFICSSLVSRLEQIEREGGIRAHKSILVIPCVNPLSMNAQHRFWLGDRADINRSFPGDDHGRSTERIAAAVLRVAQLFVYGVQLCSFNQPGDFLPHVRVTKQGSISAESLELAAGFGLPYTVRREPTPFDTATLNYAWQQRGTYAFSLYSRATDRIDVASAHTVADAVLRFLACKEVIGMPPELEMVVLQPTRLIDEDHLVDVRTKRSAGFFVPHVNVGDRVKAGQRLGTVEDAMDLHVLEPLEAPMAGRVFFMRTDPLIQQHMVAFRIAPE